MCIQDQLLSVSQVKSFLFLGYTVIINDGTLTFKQSKNKQNIEHAVWHVILAISISIQVHDHLLFTENQSLNWNSCFDITFTSPWRQQSQIFYIENCNQKYTFLSLPCWIRIDNFASCLEPPTYYWLQRYILSQPHIERLNIFKTHTMAIAYWKAKYFNECS